ncbi:MAG: carbohydrate binding family 9 domain-containing protein [Hymenobacteraceae bacterium]|nr:carbohydrate binding family 9 domain-containing protein [Hymenobacteraceae bacterium]
MPISLAVFRAAARRAGLLGLLWLALPVSRASAQAAIPPAADATPVTKRTVPATRTAASIRLDGELDEPEWATATIATGFTENRPAPGRSERHATEVRVLYDDAALYIGAVMHDATPDSVLHELTRRDNFGNADFFGIFLDPYRDGLNGYGFFLSAAGVQMDARYSNGGDNEGEDFSWNAVWESRAVRRGTDWVAELRIPYSAIRFAAVPEQMWGMNFMRQRKATNQAFFWNEIKPKVNGFVSQWGTLTGLENLRPPLRLALSPYVSGYVNHAGSPAIGTRATSTAFNGGMDVQVGLSEAFTLNSTLVPDFGQTQSDNVVLNLSPFEVRYNENRPFFLEGTELFNKGGFFYSRRVGAVPLGYYNVEGQLSAGERIKKNPGESRLLNATKISGRTRSKLGIGVFNALTRPMYATVESTADGGPADRRVLTQPLTNYNIVVLDQALAHNSYVSLVNTSVVRQGSTYDANLTGGLVRLANKTNSWAFSGRGAWTHREGRMFNSTQRIDDPDGYTAYGEYGKVSGTWTGNVYHSIESDHYNPNDLGLLFANNSRTTGLNLNYNHPDAFWKVNNFSGYAGSYYSRLFRPGQFQEVGLYAGGNTTFTKLFLTVGADVNLTPIAQRDYFEPRQEPLGRYWLAVPPSWMIGNFASSDYRKKLALDVRYSYRRFWQTPASRWEAEFSLSPRYRFNNQLTVRHNLNVELAHNREGFPGGFDDSPADAPYVGQVLMGRRQLRTVTNTTSGSYIFTDRMSLTLRVRHYYSAATYNGFFELLPAGERQPSDYVRNRAVTFNAVNVDAVFSWWFAPGSEMSLVWKDAIATIQRADQVRPVYFDNLGSTLNAPQNNSVSVKILYYLDYLTLRHRLTGA